jgi:FlaA1/EpsC-like NDP-sugar epimerase
MPHGVKITARARDRVLRWLWAVVDAGIWMVAVCGATWLRFDFALTSVFTPGTLRFALIGAVGYVAVGAVIGPYAIGHRRGSFEETLDIARTVAVSMLGICAWVLLARPPIPRSVPVMAGVLALTGMFAVRFVIRTWRTHQTISNGAQRRVIVFGAGDAGRLLLMRMVRDDDSGFTPVAVLDDDRAKGRLRVEGLRVRGTRTAMADVAQRFGASTLVIALPMAEATLIRELTELAEIAGLDVLTLPPLSDLLGGHPSPDDLREVNLNDLLGRRPITMDTTVVAEQICGRRVLVTGAGGSIGSELCRQIARFGPAKLYLLDRDESGIQATQLSLTGQGLLEGDEVVLADIRDAESMTAILASTKPDIVFHAAALKHLPLLEHYPFEAWKTNVVGTLNVLQAAAAAGVGTFVNISTDKAANPICVLGYSKRVAERVTADFSRTQPGRYVSVRFGNVLGSRGSVVHAFTAQVDRGGPLTVTHPDVERFFMLIPEACQLVLEAAVTGADGEVMVLDMGEPVRIVDVARTLIRRSSRDDIDIVFTGLRPGEKLSEDLFSDDEYPRATAHRLISSVHVPAVGCVEVRAARPRDHASALLWMRNESLSLLDKPALVAGAKLPTMASRGRPVREPSIPQCIEPAGRPRTATSAGDPPLDDLQRQWFN